MGGDKNERSFFDPKQAHAASRIVPLQWQLLLSKKKKTTHRHVLRLILIWTRRVRRGARGQQEGEGGEESELHDSGRRSF